jgi:predicted RNase H-like HicB family nuclease
MVKSYTAKYTKIDSGYLGQLIEWPEVLTEGQDIEECRSMLRDALREMLLAYQEQGKRIPLSIPREARRPLRRREKAF